MSKLYRELSAKSLVRRLCSPTGTAVYSGWMDKFGDEEFAEPAVGWLNAVANAIVIPAASTTFLGTLKTSYIDVEADPEALGLYCGLLGFVTIAGVDYQVIVIDNSTFTECICVAFLEYDSAWADSDELTISAGSFGGECSLDSVVSEFGSGFCNSAVFGSESRQFIFALYGDYNNLGSLDLSQGGTSIIGLDSEKKQAVVKPVTASCNGPVFYLGDSSDIETTVYDRQFSYGSESFYKGFTLVTNCSSVPGVVCPNVARSVIIIKLLEYGSYNYSYGPFCSSGTIVKDLVGVCSQRPFETGHYGIYHGTYFLKHSGCTSYAAFLRGYIAGILFSDLICVSGDNGLYLVLDSTSSNNVTFGNLVVAAIGDDFKDYIFNIYNYVDSPVFIDTMLVVGNYDAFVTNSLAYTGSIFQVNKLAVCGNITDMTGVAYNELIDVTGQQIFRDPDNDDYTIVNPTLISKGIGVYGDCCRESNELYGGTNNLLYSG